MLKNYLKLYWKNSKFRNEVNLTFLFKELAFVLLPLGILLPISLFFGKSTPLKFVASTDFSFVVVVLLAITLTGYIELKTKIQKSINYKLLEGLKFYILFLIASAIVLTINLLSKFEIVSFQMNDSSFAIANGILFFFGFFSLFLKILSELGNKYYYNMIREIKVRNQIVELIIFETAEIKHKIIHLLYALQNFKIDNKIDLNPEFEFNNFRKDTQEKIKNVNRMIDDCENLIENIKSKLEERKEELEDLPKLS